MPLPVTLGRYEGASWTKRACRQLSALLSSCRAATTVASSKLSPPFARATYCPAPQSMPLMDVSAGGVVIYVRPDRFDYAGRPFRQELLDAPRNVARVHQQVSWCHSLQYQGIKGARALLASQSHPDFSLSPAMTRSLYLFLSVLFVASASAQTPSGSTSSDGSCITQCGITAVKQNLAAEQTCLKTSVGLSLRVPALSDGRAGRLALRVSATSPPCGARSTAASARRVPTRRASGLRRAVRPPSPRHRATDSCTCLR